MASEAEEIPHVVKNRSTPANREFWNHVECIAAQVKERQEMADIVVPEDTLKALCAGEIGFAEEGSPEDETIKAMAKELLMARAQVEALSGPVTDEEGLESE